MEELKFNNEGEKIISISAGEGQLDADTIKEFTKTIKKLEPISKDLKKNEIEMMILCEIFIFYL